MNPDQWKEHPYINGLKSISTQAKALSKSLKKLSTYIRKIIKRMIVEETFETLTDNLIEYFDGNFVKEYARLTKQQNVYRYRGIIHSKLEQIKANTTLMESMIEECSKEEEISLDEARERMDELFVSTNRFLFDDYEKIMKDIYLAGYHSVRISKYLRKIEKPEEKEWLHFGDIDPDGYMILRNLRNKTGLDFQPYQMNKEILGHYIKYSKRLEKQDKIKANTLIAEEFYSSALKYMLENDMKLEQEVIAIETEGYRR